MTSAPTPARPGRLLAVYTLLRALLFVGCYGLLVVLGMRGLLAVAVALLVSSVLSLYVLRRQRDAVATAFEARRQQREGERAQRRSLLDDEPGAR